MSRSWRSDDTSGWLEGFGTGVSGTSYAVPANEGCSGTISTTTLTLAAAGTFANGDLVLIHQTRGAGVGTGELNKITSGGGTTTLTMAYTLENEYTDSGANQAQVIEMNQYDGMTTGAITAPAWDGSKGGILAWFDKGTTTVSAAVSASGRGFRGGSAPGVNDGKRGEGTVAAGDTTGTTANGNGGGGTGGSGRGGAGGGHAAAGTTGGNAGNDGGAIVGNSSLTLSNLGGGGGGSGTSTSTSPGAIGGGMVFIFAKNIIVTGSINVSGGNSSTSGEASGGAGAGGSCLLKCETATLGTTLVTSTGQTPPSTSWSGGRGGASSVGRIHLDYSGSYTGTTSPTIDVTLDATITGSSPSNFFLMF